MFLKTSRSHKNKEQNLGCYQQLVVELVYIIIKKTLSSDMWLLNANCFQSHKKGLSQQISLTSLNAENCTCLHPSCFFGII